MPRKKKPSEPKVRDYHDFCTIDTTKEQRQKWFTGDIWINEAKCHGCGDTVRSRNKHDFRSCTCGNIAVDGGSHYARRLLRDGSIPYTDNIVMFNDVKAPE